MSDYHHLITRIAFSHDAKTIEVREPKPGLRHNKETIYVAHRFPVKGGISLREMTVKTITMRNPLWDFLIQREFERQ